MVTTETQTDTHTHTGAHTSVMDMSTHCSLLVFTETSRTQTP